jgi:hypothetical protein
MVRLLVAAIILALAAAAAGCSGTVPPPGATLSGVVYADDNANGVRDSCDEGESLNQNPTVELIRAGSEGEPLAVKAAKGAWKLEDVPPGDYVVKLRAPQTTGRWVATGPEMEEGVSGYKLSLRGFEQISDLDFGVAEPFESYTGAGRYAVRTFYFEDRDGDGTPDADECSIDERALAAGLYGQFDDFGREVNTHSLESASLWIVTTASGRRDCADTLSGPYDDAPAIRPDSDVAITHVGVRRATGRAIVIATVFNDLNRNALLDPGEPLLPDSRAHLRPAGGSCLLGETLPEGNTPGEFSFSRLPDGQWFAEASAGYCCSPGRGPGGAPTATTPVSVEVSTKAGSTSEVHFGFSFPVSSTIVATVIDDSNGNGQADADEQPVPWVAVCANWGPPAEPGTADWRPVGICQQTDPSGVSTFTSLEPGEYSVGVELPARLESSWEVGPSASITLAEGGEHRVTMLVRRPGSVGISGCAAISC